MATDATLATTAGLEIKTVTTTGHRNIPIRIHIPATAGIAIRTIPGANPGPGEKFPLSGAMKTVPAGDMRSVELGGTGIQITVTPLIGIVITLIIGIVRADMTDGTTQPMMVIAPATLGEIIGIPTTIPEIPAGPALMKIAIGVIVIAAAIQTISMMVPIPGGFPAWIG